MLEKDEPINTPVLFLIFNRPEPTQRVFDAIRKARPKELFVSADGPRQEKPDDIQQCRAVRDIVRNVDWDCKVHYDFRDTNLGCKMAVSSAINWFFKDVEAGIILEDDCLPNQSFFWFCQELLEKYKDDERIMQISGSNYLFGQKIGEATYYFSKLNDIYGWASWRRAWKFYDIYMEDFPAFKEQKQIDNYVNNKRISQWLMDYFREAFQLAGLKYGIWSSQWSYAICKHNGLVIVPNVNLVSNIGINNEATYSKNSFAIYANISTQEIKQIIHPQFILANKKADALRFKVIYKTDPRSRLGRQLKNTFIVFLKDNLHPEIYNLMIKIWHIFKNRDIKVYDYKFYLNDKRMDYLLKKMILSYESNKKEIIISRYWKELMNKNIAQLTETGFDNFRQTLALNYFTWLLKESDPQIYFLKSNLPLGVVLYAKDKAKTGNKYPLLNDEQSTRYNFFTLLLWEFAKQQVPRIILERLNEPLLGNPLILNLDGKYISPDLINSMLEYQSIAIGVKDFQKIRTVLEIGAGYGRIAYVILSLNSNLRYIIADIPPALYVAQRYLSQVFPEKNIFQFRDFSNFRDIEKDFFSSQIIFLMPHQLKKLPDKITDLSLAIDCLHEMLPKQINFYFNMFNRLSRNLYFKCWKKTTIPYDEITLKEKDYPIHSHWKTIFWRECKVQTAYFEAFLSIPPKAI